MMKNWERLKTNKDAKILFGNFAYLSLLQIAAYVFPLITYPYLAKVIGPEGFGLIAFAASILVWLQTIVDWGFNYTATRDISRSRENHEAVSVIFSNVIWTKFFLALLVGVGFGMIVWCVPRLYEMRYLLLYTFLLIPGQILFPEWLFQGLERMKYITMINLVMKLLFTVLVFSVIKERDDYLYQPLLNSLGFLVAGAISFYIIICKWKIRFLKPSWKGMKSSLVTSFDVFLNQLFPNLYNAFSVLLLGVWCGNRANGLLDAGTKFVNIFQQLLGVISRTFFPYLSRRMDKHGFYAKYNLVLSLFIVVVLFFAAPLTIKLFFTEEFKDSVIVMRILSFSIFFLTLNNVYGTNYMILNGRERQLRNISVVSSLVGLGIAVPLIFYFNYIGAALTITITRGLIGVLPYWYCTRVKKGGC